MKTKKTESRLGVQAADIFSPTTRVQVVPQAEQHPLGQTSIVVEKAEQAIPEHPKKSVKGIVKSTVSLNNNQIVWLDRLSSDIRATTMAIVDRGAIIRAIILAVEKSKIDLCDATSEEQLSELILLKLKQQ